MIENYAILGTGAIGGFCATKLSRSGFDVHCLLRSDFSHVKKHGLTLVSDKETVTTPIKAYQSVQDMPVCDVILVALKTTENNLLGEMLPHIMHAKSIVVLLQNGIGMEQELAKFIDSNCIIGGSCILKVHKESPGVIRHFGLDSIELAQYYQDENKEGTTPVIEELVRNFAKAGIHSVAVEHLPTMRWKKLVGNLVVNGLSVVLDAYTQELIQHPISFELLCTITKEVITAAEQSGAKLPKDFFQYRLNIFKTFADMKPNYSSMKEDFNAKRPLELKAIYANAIIIAKQKGGSLPMTEMLYQQLLFLNERNIQQ